MLERKRSCDAIESLRGRLEESSSCPPKSDPRIEEYVSQEWFKPMWPKLERNEYSSPRKVAKSPLFSISIATEGGASNRVKITIRVSPDKRKNPQPVLGSRLLSFTEYGIAYSRPLRLFPAQRRWLVDSGVPIKRRNLPMVMIVD